MPSHVAEVWRSCAWLGADRARQWEDDGVGSVTDYLDTVDPRQRVVLEHVVAIAAGGGPGAEEGRSYGLAALRVLGKPLVAVQATAHHLAIYPFSPAVVSAVAPDLPGHALSKGTIRFDVDHPLPDAVLRRVVALRLAEITGPGGG